MEKNPTYQIFAAIFAKNTPSILVSNFNHEVGNRGFNSQRAAFDAALIDEFIRRGIDISAVYDGQVISFSKKIRLDDSGKKVIIEG